MNDFTEKELDEALLDAQSDNPEKDKRPVAEKLLDIALKNPRTELFRTDRKEAFIRFPVGDHDEYALCNSKSFKFWLSNEYWKRYKAVVSNEAVSSTLNVLQGRALFEGKEYKLANRVAFLNGEIWYDLADLQWRAIKINQSGWELIERTPILFRRYGHQRPQIVPVAGGDPMLIFKHINNVKNEDQLPLLATIIAAFVPDIAHPIPYFYGPQGAAKSTNSKLIKKIIDPSVIETADFSKDMREFAQQLDHSWAIMLDNVGYISHEHSDLLCRVVSGTGFSKRELYSDDDDVIRVLKRCLFINGINLLALKPDLLERCILIELERVAPEKRQDEQALYAAFEADLPLILGGILDTVSKAMRIRQNLKVSNLPRMADFALWGCAITEALGRTASDFLDSYRKNIDMQQDVVISENIEAALTVELMADRDEWLGTPSELMEQLKNIASFEQSELLPKNANVLSRNLNMLKATLDDAGITFVREPGRVRKIVLRKKPENTASVASSLPETVEEASLDF